MKMINCINCNKKFQERITNVPKYNKKFCCPTCRTRYNANILGKKKYEELKKNPEEYEKYLIKHRKEIREHNRELFRIRKEMSLKNGMCRLCLNKKIYKWSMCKEHYEKHKKANAKYKRKKNETFINPNTIDILSPKDKKPITNHVTDEKPIISRGYNQTKMKIKINEDETYEIKVNEEITIQELAGLVSRFNALLKGFNKYDGIAGEELPVKKINTSRQGRKTPLPLFTDRNTAEQVLKEWNEGNHQQKVELAKRHNRSYDDFNKSVAHLRLKLSRGWVDNPHQNPLILTKDEFQEVYKEWKNTDRNGRKEIARKLGRSVPYLHVRFYNYKKLYGVE